MPKAPDRLREFDSLLKVVAALRGPDGCPWDKEQTHQTLTRYAIEEAFELAEAIDSGELKAMKEELGDLLLQVVLHSEIGRQAGQFDIADVIEVLNEKMIRRHPHVFGDVKVDSSSQVLQNWAAIKAREKGQDVAQPLSFDIPVELPSLIRAQKVGEKTRKVNFDWANAEECWDKVREEMGELEEAVHDGAEREQIESELGDLLFSVAQLARHLNLDSEQALRKTNRRFEARFRKMQELVRADGLDWASLPADRKEYFWKKAKS